MDHGAFYWVLCSQQRERDREREREREREYVEGMSIYNGLNSEMSHLSIQFCPFPMART
jgi:hypothetical protein